MSLFRLVSTAAVVPAEGGSSGGGSKTCADLAACCAKISDASKQSSCLKTHDDLANGDGGPFDNICNSAYQSVYAAYCP